MRIKKVIPFFLQFFKFGIVGLSNTVISYLAYVLLTYIDVPYVLANIIGFIVSVLNSFFWNNKYVFKKNEHEKRNVWWSLCKTFLSYAGTILILSNILLIVFVELIGISKYIAPIIGLVITIPLNFLINKFWSFKTRKIDTNE